MASSRQVSTNSNSNTNTNTNTRIFVYGTLLRGYTNYQRYLKHAVEGGKAALLGTARTVQSYPLILRPLTYPPATRGPMLLSDHGSPSNDWVQIDGEVYDVTADVLEALDILEGVPSGCYYKEIIETLPLKVSSPSVSVSSVDMDVAPIKATAYFYTIREGDTVLLNTFPLLTRYDDTAHNEYVPGPMNMDILNLIKGQEGKL